MPAPVSVFATLPMAFRYVPTTLPPTSFPIWQIIVPIISVEKSP